MPSRQHIQFRSYLLFDADLAATFSASRASSVRLRVLHLRLGASGQPAGTAARVGRCLVALRWRGLLDRQFESPRTRIFVVHERDRVSNVRLFRSSLRRPRSFRPARFGLVDRLRPYASLASRLLSRPAATLSASRLARLLGLGRFRVGFDLPLPSRARPLILLFARRPRVRRGVDQILRALPLDGRVQRSRLDALICLRSIWPLRAGLFVESARFEQLLRFC